MNVEYSTVTRVRNDEVEVGDWEPWVMLRNPTIPEKPPLWVRSRAVQMNEHVEIDHIGQSCTKKCPVGYRPTGGGQCLWASPTPPSHPPTLAIPMVHVSSPSKTTTHHDTSWTRFDREWGSGLDPKGTFKKLIKFALQSKHDVTDEEIVEILPLPAMCEGERVVLGDRKVDNYHVSINGEEYESHQVVDTADLGVGYHLMEVFGMDEELGELHVQMPLSVISPVEFVVQPVTEVEITDDVNGGIVQVELFNRSKNAGELSVHVDMHAMPPGWMAVCLGEPNHILKPGEDVEIEVQVEEMVPQPLTEREPDLLPFTIRASLPGSPAADVFSTFLVAHTGEERSDQYSVSPAPQIP